MDGDGVERDHEGKDWLAGGAAAMGSVISLVIDKYAWAVERWDRTPVEHHLSRAYWRGRVKSYVDLLKELGVDE